MGGIAGIETLDGSPVDVVLSGCAGSALPVMRAVTAIAPSIASYAGAGGRVIELVVGATL